MHTVEIQRAHRRVARGRGELFVGRNFVLSVRNRSAQNLLGVRDGQSRSRIC
jgi:hypothetical protein